MIVKIAGSVSRNLDQGRDLRHSNSRTALPEWEDAICDGFAQDGELDSNITDRTPSVLSWKFVQLRTSDQNISLGRVPECSEMKW